MMGGRRSKGYSWAPPMYVLYVRSTLRTVCLRDVGTSGLGTVLYMCTLYSVRTWHRLHTGVVVWVMNNMLYNTNLDVELNNQKISK